MKKLLSLTLVILSVTVAAFGLCGCSVSDKIIYENAENYKAGNVEISDTIEKIEVDWVSGMLNVETHSQKSVIIDEDTDDSADDDSRVHWWLDGTTLRIKYCASGKVFNFNKKDLTLKIPDGIELSECIFDTTSADISIDDIKANHILASSTSGSINAECEGEKIDIDSTSGDVILNQKGGCKKIIVNTTSGKTEGNISFCEDLSVDSTSGDVTLYGSVSDSVVIDTSSGIIDVNLSSAPMKCSLDSTSGDVSLRLPESAGFTAKIDTSSGKFDSDFSLKKQNDTYISGDGSSRIDISTTSGNIELFER